MCSVPDIPEAHDGMSGEMHEATLLALDEGKSHSISAVLGLQVEPNRTRIGSRSVNC